MHKHAMESTKKLVACSAVTAACLMALASAQAATINITSRDAPGVGFNDTTPADPVGGNPGTTVGQQRLNVYRHVANLWEAALQSTVTINVSAGWEALTCTASTAVLGSAGAWNIWFDFPNGKPGTWYPQALANKLAGMNLSDGQADDGSGYGNVDIKTQFNINLGNPDCLAGSPFYLGLDGKAGAKVDFLTTLLHELGHGLGFSVLTVSTSTGNRLNASGSAFVANGGLPSVWEQFMFDNTAGKSWLNMTSAERKASAINPLQLAWTGPNAVAGASLLSDTPVLIVRTPVPGASGLYDYAGASFGPAITSPSYIGALALGPGTACDPFDAPTTAAVAGKWAIVDRGVCTFVVKVKNAQNAGAIGVVVADNAPGAPATLGGSDATITIPAVRITQAAGATLKSAVANSRKYGPRSRPGQVVASFGADTSRKAGADALGRPLLYTPSTLAPGSSVSHWDVSAFPNLLMEPNISSDLTTSLVPPKDLTKPLLLDLGW